MIKKRQINYLCKKNIKMDKSKISFTEDINKNISEAINIYDKSQIFVLTDSTTTKKCLPLINALNNIDKSHYIEIEASDTYKNIESLSKIWMSLSTHGATRKSVLINIGGGMVTDIGGFAASSFKRGISFINIPTTILAAVDASVGGKTGINFNGLKNEIGAFSIPKEVIICNRFFKTLDRENILSGFAEMLKHGLLSNNSYLKELLSLDLTKPESPEFLSAIKTSVKIKENITEQDPTEKGLRKALNLGHTAGHAFESLSHHRKDPVLHGYAVAYGIMCELYLCLKRFDFPQETFQRINYFIKEEYGIFHISCDDYPYLLNAMTHDKKNTSKEINFTLLSDIGKIKLNQTADAKEIEEALDFYQDFMGI